MAAAARASRGFLDYVGIGISAGLITASFALLAVNAAATYDFLTWAKVCSMDLKTESSATEDSGRRHCKCTTQALSLLQNGN
jgi:hypothetical protein